MWSLKLLHLCELRVDCNLIFGQQATLILRSVGGTLCLASWLGLAAVATHVRGSRRSSCHCKSGDGFVADFHCFWQPTTLHISENCPKRHWRLQDFFPTQRCCGSFLKVEYTNQCCSEQHSEYHCYQSVHWVNCAVSCAGLTQHDFPRSGQHSWLELVWPIHSGAKQIVNAWIPSSKTICNH